MDEERPHRARRKRHHAPSVVPEGRNANVTAAVTRSVTTAVTETVTTARDRAFGEPAAGPSTDAVRSRWLDPDCVDRGGVAEFRLYDGATGRLLGTHHSLEAACAAADEHSLAVLADVGEWVTVEHLLACVDETGCRIRLASELTHLGPPDDLEECREWLRRLPGRRDALPD